MEITKNIEPGSKATKITLRRFDDMHLHLRDGDLMRAVLPFTVRYASRAIIMPNLRPAILTGANVISYRDRIMRAVDESPGHPAFEPLMTIEIRDDTTPKMVIEAKKAGAIAGKVYPRGVTTNSDEGLSDFFNHKISETFRAMQDIRMPLLLHGELDYDSFLGGGKQEVLVTQREHAFIFILLYLAKTFPNLKIVLEHISTLEAANEVAKLGKNIAATITAHHLSMTLNDVIGYKVRPHNACNPMPKDFTDRDALRFAATSGNPKFFLGSDSAPHFRQKKECAEGACGVFTAPVLPAVLVVAFEEKSSELLWKLEDFTSRFGAEFYGLKRNEETITLIREEWAVPTEVGVGEIGSVVPFKAGESLQWRLL